MTKPKPRRVQRKRGVKLPPHTRYVGRGSRWGNVWRVGDDGIPDRAAAVARYRESSRHWAPWFIAMIKRELRGWNLACWCPLDGGPCHANVLLEIANEKEGE